jgi:hypothetical protein
LTQAFSFLCGTPKELKESSRIQDILTQFEKADPNIRKKFTNFLDNRINKTSLYDEFIDFSGTHTVSNGWFHPTVTTTHYLYLTTSAWKDGKLILAVYYKTYSP